MALLCLASSAHSQSFDSAVGLRLGTPFAVSYKTFISEDAAIEGYLGYRNYGYGFGLGSSTWLSVNGLYQIHNDIESLDGLQWYYGGGGGIHNFSFAGASTTFFGVTGVVGLSYTLEDLPLNVSIDWVPGVFIGGGGSGVGGFGGGYFGLAARYVLN